MAFVEKLPGTGGDDTTGTSTPLSTGGGAEQPAPQDPTPQPETPTMDVGASAVEGQQTQTTSKAAPKASSGMFTNIQKYVQRNRPQAQQMGKAVKQDVETKASDIRNVVGEKQDELTTALGAAATTRAEAEEFAAGQIGAITGVNPVTGKKVLQGFGSPTQTTKSTGTYTADPVQGPNLTPTEDVIGKYKSLMGDDAGFGKFGYQDPQAPDISAQVLKAKELANDAQRAATERGRQNLLKETFRKQGDYTRGMSGLDQLIMAGDPAAMQHVADIQQIGHKLMQGGVDDPNTLYDESQGIGQIAMGMSTSAANEAKLRQEALDRIKAQYEGAVSGIEDPIQGRLDEAQTAYDLLYGDTGELKTSFGEGGDYALTQDALDALNLQEGMSLYGVDPTAYMTGLTDPTLAGVMTKGELDKLKALEMISGKGSTMSGYDEVGGYDPSKGFDMEAFQSAIQQKKEALNEPLWNQASTAIDQRDQAERDLLAYVKKKTGKSYRSVEEMNSDSFLNTSYMDQRELDRLQGAIDSADSQLASISKTIYNQPDIAGVGGLGNIITGTGPSDLGFYTELDRSLIDRQLAEIARLKADKIKLQK